MFLKKKKKRLNKGVTIIYHYKKRAFKPRFLAAFLKNAAKEFRLSHVFEERGSTPGPTAGFF